MSLGLSKEQQCSMWFSSDQMPQNKEHAFYERLQQLLRREGFNAFLEGLMRSLLRRKARSQNHPVGPLFPHAFNRFF